MIIQGRINLINNIKLYLNKKGTKLRKGQLLEIRHHDVIWTVNQNWIHSG